jgi:hypothetical protein
MHLVFTPAYGRDYTSKKALLADFKAKKDFVLNSPSGTTYANITDLLNDRSWQSLQFRYKRNTQVAVLNRKQVEALA